MDTRMCICIVLLFVVTTTYAKQAVESKSRSGESRLRPDTRRANLEAYPCKDHRCGSGRECTVDKESRAAVCKCVSECPENKDPRRQVCSNQNQTWPSDCHLYRQRCLCLDGLPTALDCKESDKHMHIDYYGQCADITGCTKDILDDFPRRMREWLYTVLSTKTKSIDSKASGKGDAHASRWVEAVVWKYCDLDVHPSDRHVSRHELFPLRAPLLSMEPCISNFLDSCDPDDDHKITLEEWGNCLGAPKGELEYKCTQFKALVNGA